MKSRIDFRIKGNVAFLKQNVEYHLKYFQINSGAKEYLKQALDRFIKDVNQVVECNKGTFEAIEEKELLTINKENPFD